MSKQFSSDPVGAILEYLYLTQDKNSTKYLERNDWEKTNNQPKRPMVWNGHIEPHIMNELINGRKRSPAVKAQINRIFSKLEHNDLIEPYSSDDSITTTKKVITLLGEELLLDNRYLEYINGLKYIAEKWKKSIAKIYDPSNSGIGTGFLISNNQLATAKHVVDAIKNIEIRFEDDVMTYNAANIIIPQKVNDLDLAIIELNQKIDYLIPLKISNDYNILDDVVILGYPPVPMSDDAYLVANKGEVSSIVKLYRNDIQHLVVSTLIRGGNSGGPIINKRGDVIGVITENLYKKVKAEELENFGLNEGLAFSAGICSDWLSDLKNGII